MRVKRMLGWLPFAGLAVGTAGVWFGTVSFLLHARRATGRLVTFEVSSGGSRNASHPVYEFQLPDGQRVLAIDEVGGPGDGEIGSTRTIYYDTRAHYARKGPDGATADLSGAPKVYGALWKAFLVPVFLLGLTLIVGLVTWAFVRHASRSDQGAPDGNA